MYLLDEKTGKVVDVNVTFTKSNKAKKTIINHFNTLLKEENAKFKRNYPEDNKRGIDYYYMGKEVTAPLEHRLIIENGVLEFPNRNLEITTFNLSYNAPYTIGFMYSKLPNSWLNEIRSTNEEVSLVYANNKGENIDLDDLSGLIPDVENIQTFASILREIKANPLVINYFLTNYHPDLKAFRAIVSYLDTENYNYDNQVTSKLSDEVYVKAKNNSTIIKTLKQLPNNSQY